MRVAETPSALERAGCGFCGEAGVDSLAGTAAAAEFPPVAETTVSLPSAWGDVSSGQNGSRLIFIIDGTESVRPQGQGIERPACVVSTGCVLPQGQVS